MLNNIETNGKYYRMEKRIDNLTFKRARVSNTWASGVPLGWTRQLNLKATINHGIQKYGSERSSVII